MTVREGALMRLRLSIKYSLTFPSRPSTSKPYLNPKLETPFLG